MQSEVSSQIPTVGFKIHYWTANERQCEIPDDNISAFCYHEKESKRQDGGQKSQAARSQYYRIKQRFVESRGGMWTLPNKRPERLRDSLREMEEILKSRAVLHLRWEKRNQIQIVINTGLIINILLSEFDDVYKVFFDKSMVAKITEVGSATAARLTSKFCLLCFDDKNKLGFVSFTQRPGTPENKQASSRISSMDMRISFHNMPGAVAQRSARKICVNAVQDKALCWCSSHSTPGNWTQNATEQEKANMVLLNCSYGRLEVCNYIYTESNPISVEFSKKNPYQILSLERSVTSKNEVVLQYVTYECTQSKLQRLEVNLVPVKSGVLSCARNTDESKLAVGCTDGTVVIYDTITKSILSVRDSIVPSIVSWHPNGGVVMVASGTAELRCYDCALGKLSTSLLQDVNDVSSGNILKLSKFLPGENGLIGLTWPSIESDKSTESASAAVKHTPCHDAALVLFDGGPLALIKLSLGIMRRYLLQPIEIIKEHIAHENMKPAIQVLRTINWNTEPRAAFFAMINIVNHLLKQDLTFESEELLEGALSAFYAPKHPIAEPVVVEYRHAVSRYARRFFQHLLRFKRLHKAFLLAKDLQDLDLFVDVYFSAKERGETDVARAAKLKMLELYSSSDEDSDEEGAESIKKVTDYKLKKQHNPKLNANIVKRKNKPFKVTSPRIRKEIVPPSYPPPKMDDFMKSLISETRAVLEGQTDLPKDPIEALPKGVTMTGSSLKILDYGYV